MDIIQETIKNKINKFLISPSKLSILLCLTVLFFAFIVYHPAYNICDDYIMRSVADGTLNPYIGPSNFLFYISSYYGEILKKLYLFNPNIYWYDLLFYILMSISLLVSSFCIFKNNDKIYNSISFITIFCIYLPLFLSMQFTIVSGMLAVAAVILAIYSIKENLSKNHLIFNCFLIIFFITFSCLIRYHAFFAVAIIGFCYFLLFIKKVNIKKVFVISTVILFAIGLNFGIYEKSQYNIKNNTAQKKCLDFNTAQVALFNDTIAAENVFHPWKNPEKNIKNLDKILKKSNLTVGDYRLLLTWSYIGNDNIFSITNLETAVKNLSPKIKLKNNFKLKFALDDYRKVAKSYFLIMFCLIILFPSRNTLKFGIIFTAIFIFYIIALNIPFRATPYRLWINFTSLMILTFLQYLKYNNNKFLSDKFKFDNKYINIVILILCVVIFFFIAFKPAKKYVKFNKQINKIYQIIKNNINKLDKNKVYFVDIYQLEAASKPFKPNLYRDFKHIPAVISLHFPQVQNLLNQYNIPKNNTWEYICSNDKFEILTITDGPYYDFFFEQIRLAVSKHMKDRYNKDITFVLKQNYGSLQSFSCEIMTEEDINFAHKLKKANMYNYIQDMENNINNGNF